MLYTQAELEAAMAAAGLAMAPTSEVAVPSPTEASQQDSGLHPVGAALSAALGVPKHCRRLHSLLLGLGLEVSPSPATQAVFFLPLELLAMACKRDRSNIWRQLKILEKLKLVYHRPLVKKSQVLGRPVAVGTLWWVQLKGPSPAFVLPEDFAADYRDIDADIASGDTVYAMQQSLNGISYSLLKEMVFKGIRYNREMTVASRAETFAEQTEAVATDAAGEAVQGSLLQHHHFFFPSNKRFLAPQIDALAHRIGRNLGLNYVPFWRGVLWHGYKTGMLHYVAAMVMEGVADIRAGSPKEEISKRVGGLLRKNLPPKQRLRRRSEALAQNAPATPLAMPLSSPVRHLPVGA